MTQENTAARIVEIQRALTTAKTSQNVEGLLAEQRLLWDRDYRGRSFDEIAHDAWLVKRSTRY